MKHGYTVVGRDDQGEFVAGRYDTKSAAVKCYTFVRNTEPSVKALRIVELVERDITAELTS